MGKKILINAKYAEEKRVAIVDGNVLEDFYSEASGKEHLRGNIYKGVVTRIEPGLQAAFVDYGPKKHGFLQFREIMKEFFQNQGDGKKMRIQDLIAKGQELIVQVEKDERDTKGASLTTFISIPGRYIVMMPGQKRVGISRKIEKSEDRERLKEIFNALKLPPDMGFILRSASSDRTSEEFENDLKYLTKLWTRIKADSKKSKAPALIYQEQDIAVRTVRDYLTSDVDEVLIDDQEAFKKTKEFLKKTTPWRKINITYYKERVPILAKYDIEEQIEKIRDRYVYLPSRGYLVIDKTEALTAVDVNSGRSRKEENIESTALRTNLEAADEVARQFRLRDIGGLIVIDFIDMESSKNRREVENRLKKALSTDKAHTEISGISKFGMVELTRERLRTAYFEAIHKKCELCQGEGVVRTDEMVAIAALRDMHAKAAKGDLLKMTCRLPVDSLNYLINTRRAEIAGLEKDFGVAVTLTGDKDLFAGQYKVDVVRSEPEKPVHPEKSERHAQHDRGQSAKHPQHERGQGAKHERHPQQERGQSAKHERAPHEEKTRGAKHPQHERGAAEKTDRHAQHHKVHEEETAHVEVESSAEAALPEKQDAETTPKPKRRGRRGRGGRRKEQGAEQRADGELRRQEAPAEEERARGEIRHDSDHARTEKAGDEARHESKAEREAGAQRGSSFDQDDAVPVSESQGEHESGANDVANEPESGEQKARRSRRRRYSGRRRGGRSGRKDGGQGEQVTEGSSGDAVPPQGPSEEAD